MRYRLIALAVTLTGFLAINYYGNELGQARILGPVDAAGLTGGTVAEDNSRLETEAYALIRQVLIGTRAMLDTLETMGVRTEHSADLREKNRASLERFEQLRMSYLLSQILWRQTLINLIWAVFGIAILLPGALLLDHRSTDRSASAAKLSTGGGMGGGETGSVEH